MVKVASFRLRSLDQAHLARSSAVLASTRLRCSGILFRAFSADSTQVYPRLQIDMDNVVMVDFVAELPGVGHPEDVLSG